MEQVPNEKRGGENEARSVERCGDIRKAENTAPARKTLGAEVPMR